MHGRLTPSHLTSQAVMLDVIHIFKQNIPNATIVPATTQFHRPDFRKQRLLEE